MISTGAILVLAGWLGARTMDAGLTGADWIAENASDVHVVSELAYSKATTNPARWVLAVPNDSPVKSVKDLQGKRIATELVELTRRWLTKNGVTAEVEFSWGATEVKAPELVDAIVELTETGSSLKATFDSGVLVIACHDDKWECHQSTRDPNDVLCLAAPRR